MTGVIEIVNKADDPDFSIDPTQPRQVKISFKQDGYSPASALRSLLRTAWLLLDPKQRQRYPNLLEIIRGDGGCYPTEYIDVTLPGIGYNYVLFDVWEKSNDQFPGAALAVRLLVANIAILWLLPKEDGSTSRPSLMPPVPSFGDSHNLAPTVAIQGIPDTLRKPPTTGSILLAYADSVEVTRVEEQGVPLGSQNYILKSYKQMGRRVPVTIRVGTTHEGFEFNTRMQLQQADICGISARFSGDDLCGEFVLHEAIHIGEFAAKFKRAFQGAPVEQVQKTIRFLESLGSSECVVYSRVSESAKILGLQPNTTKWDFSREKQIIEWLETVNKEFGTNMVFPNSTDAHALENLIILANGIRHGRVRTRTPCQLEFSGDGANAKELLDLLRKPEPPRSITLDMTDSFNIGGTSIDIGPWSLTLDGFSFQPMPTRMPEGQGSESARHMLHVPSRIYEFSRWQRSKAEGTYFTSER